MSDRIKKLGRELADQHMKGYAVGRREALADAKARIEEINIEHHVMPHRHDDYALFEVALNCALAALTQPQSEGCPDCESEDGMKDHPDGAAPCPTCRPETDGGGAATAAGARGADLEARIEALAKDWETWDGMRHERYISELRALIEPQSEEPGPYVEAFRERVCPVPEMPSVKYSPSKPVPWLAPEFSGIGKEES